jgi:hypothetical protein
MSNFNVYKYFNNRRLVENEEGSMDYLLKPIINIDLSGDVYKIIKANKNILDSETQFHSILNRELKKLSDQRAEKIKK